MHRPMEVIGKYFSSLVLQFTCGWSRTEIYMWSISGCESKQGGVVSIVTLKIIVVAFLFWVEVSLVPRGVKQQDIE